LVVEFIREIENTKISPLDLLPQADTREKLVNLVIQGVPSGIPQNERRTFARLRQAVLDVNVENVKVVVFGGGTGLSNIIGGDSRQPFWEKRPFSGLKTLFPNTKSIVCVTDNGGSTGEILKDLPLIGVGDMRHVLISSVQGQRLQQLYGLGESGARAAAENIHYLFNYRFARSLFANVSELQSIRDRIASLPEKLADYIEGLIRALARDLRLASLSERKNCLGNLLLVASFYQEISPALRAEEIVADHQVLYRGIELGLEKMCQLLGCGERAVMPCTPTPAQLRVRYANGVEIIGEHKLESSKRGYPVEGVEVEYCGNVEVYKDVVADILSADILIMAPGSLYSSIIPVLKVPGLVEAVRRNTQALKILIGNLWVQAGETDSSLEDPERKFRLSDMIRAYEKNIPGGVQGLVDEVVCIALKDIPGSVLQNYAVEGKSPIYLDREEFSEGAFTPIECDVYSREALAVRGVIQHDPDTLALAVKTLYSIRKEWAEQVMPETTAGVSPQAPVSCASTLPCRRFFEIKKRLAALPLSLPDSAEAGEESLVRETICEFLWDHPIIPLCHLDYISGICCLDIKDWDRDQQWDNVFSFYDPESRKIKIRGDQVKDRSRLETGFMIALGESLLGDYALTKIMQPVLVENDELGRVYRLNIRPEQDRHCFLSPVELEEYLVLSRMVKLTDACYTRLVNKGEGFTPPGLLMGLMYAWYVDNRLASHIEYKMSIMKINQSDLIPEQFKMSERRKMMIEFFKDVVFHDR